MSLDKKITEAIEKAVTDAGQPEAVTRRLVAWLEAINSGNEDINDAAQAERHLEVLYEATLAGSAAISGDDAS